MSDRCRIKIHLEDVVRRTGDCEVEIRINHIAG